MKGSDGNVRKTDAILELKQSGSGLTGRVGTNEWELYEVSNIKLEGDKLTFRLQPDANVWDFAFTVAGEDMTGTVTRQRDDGSKATLPVTLRRLAAPALAGTWKGVSEVMLDGQMQKLPVIMEVKQDAAAITGTVIAGESQPLDIRSGKVEGDKLTFKVFVDDGTWDVTLTAMGKELKGEAVRADNGQKSKVSLTKAD